MRAVQVEKFNVDDQKELAEANLPKIRKEGEKEMDIVREVNE